MKKLVENYRKPTPNKWRRIGDAALVLAIAIEPAIQTMPIEDMEVKNWLVWGFSTGLILFKFWTNTRV